VCAALIETALSLVMLAACLFGAAGTLRWPAGWGAIGLYTLHFALGLLLLDRELVAVRAGREPAQRWDAALSSAGFLFLFPFMLLVTGLDAGRYHWSPPLPVLARGAALVFFALGQGVALWAARANRFFVKFVRIQPERGHRVVRHGPYAYIRHPGYAGSLVAQLAMPVMLGSLWGLVPAAIGTVLFAVRTRLEDAFLHAELPGYREYAGQVRWRLLPGLW
jgi:protein-S-isoprenylcysteine O-methyltransferase Ste14